MHCEFFSSFLANKLAKIVPDIECHTHEIAHGTMLNGFVAMKNVDDNTVANPAFCIPISMETVRFLAVENLNSVPTK